ncbi:hypothetical protein QUB33_06100 [Microcoleus sp. B3-A4]
MGLIESCIELATAYSDRLILEEQARSANREKLLMALVIYASLLSSGSSDCDSSGKDSKKKTMIPITSDEVYDWNPNQKVYVYSADYKCLELCRVIDLDLSPLGDRTRFLEPVDDNLQLCTPKERELPPNCVGGRHCPYPETCYRFETEQQDYECTFPSEADILILGDCWESPKG